MPDEDKNFGGFLVLDILENDDVTWKRSISWNWPTCHKIAEFIKPKLREESLFPNTNNHPEYDHMVPASWTLGKWWARVDKTMQSVLEDQSGSAGLGVV